MRLTWQNGSGTVGCLNEMSSDRGFSYNSAAGCACCSAVEHNAGIGLNYRYLNAGAWRVPSRRRYF
jgi:hypothetical protein